jgi:hypothetical protein
VIALATATGQVVARVVFQGLREAALDLLVAFGFLAAFAFLAVAVWCGACIWQEREQSRWRESVAADRAHEAFEPVDFAGEIKTYRVARDEHAEERWPVR